MPDTIDILLRLQDQFTTPLDKATAALNNFAAKGQRAAASFRAAAAPLTGLVTTLAGAALSFGTVSKSLDEASQAQQGAAKLRAALGENIKQFERLSELATEISKTTVNDDDDIIALAAELLQRGVAVEKLDIAIKATVETAAALNLSLDGAGQAVAVTFGGNVPRELGKSVKALNGLTEEQLRAGAGAELLANRFNGAAAALGQTDFGRAARASNELGNALAVAGDQFIKVKVKLLEGLVPAVERLSASLSSSAGLQGMETLGNVVGFVASNADRFAYAFAALKGLQLASAAGKSLWAALQGIQYVGAALFSQGGLLVAGVGLTSIGLAQVILKVLGVKTNVSDTVRIVKDLWARFSDGTLTLKGLGQSIWTELKVIGTYFRVYLFDVPIAYISALNEQAQAKLDQLAARTAAGLQRALRAVGAVSDKDVRAADGEVAKADLAAATAPNALGASADAISKGNAEVAAMRKAAQEQAYADAAEEDRRNALKARVKKEQDGQSAPDGAAAPNSKIAEQLMRELELRRLKAEAALAGDTAEADRLHAIYDQRQLEIEQEKRIQSLRQDGATDAQIEQEKEIQAIERVAGARDAMRKAANSALGRAEKAQGELNDSISRNADLAKAGSITFEDAQRRNIAATDAFKEKVRSAEEEVRGQLASGLLSEADARDILDRLERIKRGTELIDPNSITGNLRSALFDLEQQFGTVAQNIARGFTSVVGGAVDSITGGITAVIMRTKSWGEALRDIGTSILTSIVSAIVRMGVQWIATQILMATVGRALAAASTATITAGAGAASAAWATPATLATIATLGTAAATAPALITSASAATTASSVAMSTGAGFADGGYTGDGPRDGVAGVVHGQEYVLDADTTSRYRGVIEAIHNRRIDPRIHTLLAGRDLSRPGGPSNSSLRESTANGAGLLGGVQEVRTDRVEVRPVMIADSYDQMDSLARALAPHVQGHMRSNPGDWRGPIKSATT